MSDTKRFSLIDMKPGETVAVPPPAPTPPPPSVVRGQTVSESGAARALEDEAAAKAAGFSPRPPLYAIGTMVVQAGVDNARLSRQKYENMPFTDSACKALAEQVQAEDRQDHLVKAADLNLLNSGLLKTSFNGELPMTERAFEALCTFVTPGGGGYLAQCPPDLRATNLNHWFPVAKRLDKRAYNRALAAWVQENNTRTRFGQPQLDPLSTKSFMVPREMTLRTRKTVDAREIFSTVGPRYGAFDIDRIASEIAQGCPGDSRCDITYDGFRARFNVLYHSTVSAEEYVAGEIFKAGILVSTADDGSGAIKISAVMYRNLCLNLIVIDFNRLLVGSRRHIGEGKSIAEDVRAHMAEALNKIGHFAKKWGEANVEDVLARYAEDGITDIRALFEGLVKNRVVYVPGVKPDDMIERLVRAWDQEPGRTKASVVNAITRAAHEEPWRLWTTTEDLERTAGELLFTTKAWDVKLKEEDPFADQP